jgi:hypothetical protein
VPPRVLTHAFLRIDDEQRRVRARRARHHVLEELHVARRIDDDVVPQRALEEHPRRVDRDALGLLVLQRVEQERVFERLRVPGAGGANGVELSLGQGTGIGEQAADDGALPVIDVTGDDNREGGEGGRALGV